MIKPVKIGNYLVGPNQPCFIIAEAGVNHNGDILLAHQLIDAAVKAGADSVKFQSFVAEDLVTADTPKAEYQLETTGKKDGQYEMLKMLELSEKQQSELKKHCLEAGIIYLCTPYEKKSVDMLDRLSVAAFKIAATDATNIPLLRYIAEKNRPVILSTGMSTIEEVEQAVGTLSAGGLDGKIVLLHCVSSYPAQEDETNLRAISTMQQKFCCPVGFSDHTPGIGISPFAVAAGACMIEKHFTLDRKMPGPDHRASLEPDELFELVQSIRRIEKSLGDGIKKPMPSELKNKAVMQKSLVACLFISKGEVITAEKLTCKRPATGLSPLQYDNVVGKRAAVDIPKGGILIQSSVDWGE